MTSESVHRGLCTECTMNLTLASMRRNKWYTVEELGERVKSRRALANALTNLGYRQKVIGVRVPGLGQKRFWHRSISSLDRPETPDGLVSMFAVPWWMKLTFAEKFSQLRQKGLIRRELPKWLRAEMIIEQYLIRAGLYYPRPRAKLGFGCSCAWRVNPERYPRTGSRTDGMYNFRVDFIAKVKTKTVLPPFDKDTDVLGVRGWIDEDRHEYEVWANSGTRIRLTSVAEFRANPRTGMIAGPTPEQLTAQTANRLMKGVSSVPALTIFLPTNCEFSLLSKEPRGETRT